MDRSKLTTEKANPRSRRIDTLSTLRIVELINSEDAKVPAAVARQKKQIARAAELMVASFRRGGRAFYVGAGTSGRLGVLDAAECPPTFGTKRSMVQGIIAGGRRALVQSIEGAEDSAAAGAAEIDKRKVGPDDMVIGIAACGLTPFVHGALRRAMALKAATALITCAAQAHPRPAVDVIINPLIGAEVITGSTRMKAGTATKLVLNTLSTTAMVRLGKVYGNLMVDLRAVNAKLRDRAERIVMAAAGVTRRRAKRLLKRAGGSAKVAILMHHSQAAPAEAARLLESVDGSLRKAIEKGRRE